MIRRRFLSLLGGAAVWPIAAKAQTALIPMSREDWLDRLKEPILDPELPIVDPHHHLWVRPTGWRYMLDDLLVDTRSGHNIVATVFVQANSMLRNSGPEELRPVGETEFVNGVGAICASGYCGKTLVCAGIVGHANLRLGSRVEPVLAALQRAGGDRFRGIRHSAAWDADTSLNLATSPGPGLLTDRTFREGFAVLSRVGLSYDTWLYHPQIDELADLAKAFPDTKIVLNHVGGPLGNGAYRGKREDVFPRWAASIKALAVHPNVYVKLGGLGQIVNGLGLNEESEPPSSATLAAAFRPYFETCIEAFGPSRSMFESNFPVDKVSYSYPVFWNACKLIAKGASASERADLFSGTAARFYRLAL